VLSDRDYFQTFETPEGKRVLKDLNRHTGALRANKPVNNDALLMAYKEGQRSILIHIYAKLNKQINEPKGETND
jgi:hypothetical protein